MKTTIKAVKTGFKLTVKSAIKTIKPLTFLADSQEKCEEARAGFEELMQEFETAETRNIARTRYNRVCERATALSNAYPNLYLVDENVSVENASDGLFEELGYHIKDTLECDWPTVAFDHVADSLIADTAYRCAENGIDGAPFGFTY
jgi:hypothetical protein